MGSGRTAVCIRDRLMNSTALGSSLSRVRVRKGAGNRRFRRYGDLDISPIFSIFRGLSTFYVEAFSVDDRVRAGPAAKFRQPEGEKPLELLSACEKSVAFEQGLFFGGCEVDGLAKRIDEARVVETIEKFRRDFVCDFGRKIPA